MKGVFLFFLFSLSVLSWGATLRFINAIDEDDFDELVSYSTRDESAFNVFSYFSNRQFHNFCILYDTLHVTKNSPDGLPLRITDAYTYLGRSPSGECDVNISFSVYAVNRLTPENAVGERIGYSGPLRGTMTSSVVQVSGMSIDVFAPYFWACFSLHQNTETSIHVGPLYETIERSEAAPWSFSFSTSSDTVTSNNVRSRLDASSRFFFGLMCEEVPDDVIASLWNNEKDTCKDGYNDELLCNCECGIVDPDCYNEDVHNNTCGEGHVCIEGKCADPKWRPSDFCSMQNFGDGGVCNCGCGNLSDPNYLDDPDCFFNIHVQYECEGVSALCDVNSLTCSNDTWTCDRSAYADGRICDCGCGLQDPDCNSDANPTNCPNDNRCVDGLCAYPKKWNTQIGGCEGSAYNASDGICNCGCGAYDPDCDGGTYTEIKGCGDLTQNQYSCDFTGHCLKAFCGNDFVDLRLGEVCDGGLGCSTENCKCLKGYTRHNLTSVFCDPVCGDNITVEGEECDGSVWCNNATCRCAAGHPVNKTPGICTGCGNGVAEYGEECDGGEGCNEQCKCKPGYKPYAHLERACYKEDKGAVIAIACVCSGIVVLVIIVIVVWVVLSHRTKKIVESADSRIEKNNEVMREEEESQSLPGQVPMALLSKDQTLLTSTSTGVSATGAVPDMGSTNTGLGDTTAGGDTLGSTMTQDFSSGAGMTLDDDDDDGPKKKTIRINVAPPPQ